MRLTEKQRAIIREAGLRHFGVVPLLFGSRLRNDARGGDIDLFIPGRWTPGEAVPRRLSFCAELSRRLGERRIDVVIELDTESPIVEHARTTGEAV